MIPIVISIDGNIGSGKSTLFENLKNHYSNNKKIGFAEEPVDKWVLIKDKDDVNILENLYKNTKKYSFRFQMMAYISRLSLLKNMIEENKYEIIFTERSVFTDKEVFAKKLYDDGFIEKDEYTIYNMWFQEFLKEIRLHSVIYVNVDPEICLQRIEKRNRKGENIQLDYLNSIHQYHNKWLLDSKCDFNLLNINANFDTDKIEYVSKKKEWVNLVVEYIESINLNTKFVLQFDGACRGNPNDRCGLGAVLFDKNNKIGEISKYIELKNASNNVAEYLALIEGCKLCIEKNIKNIEIQGDSLLVLKQLGNEYKIKSENLLPHYHEASKLLEYFSTYKLIHIERQYNSYADKLANIALDSKNYE